MIARATGWRAGVATCVVTGVIGCNSGTQSTVSGDAVPRAAENRAPRPVPLPDLSSASESVRRQLRDAHTSLTERVESPHTTTADRGSAYGDMGKLFMAAEYRDEAEACLLNARALAPDDMRWPYYLGHLHKAKGETAKSAAAFEDALKLKPDDQSTLVWLGTAYLDQGRPDAAQPLFARALSQQPRSMAALAGAGRAALAQSDYVRAVQHLEQALALDPQAAALHYPLAMAYRGLGDAQKAEAHLRRRAPGEIRPSDPLMLDLDGLLDSAVGYEVRGAKALDRRDWAAAAASFRKGIELAPNEPSLHHKLGTALYLNGDARGASAEFEEALRLSPTFAKAHYSLGVIMGASGRPGSAIEHLAAAVRHDPAYVDARLRLADVFRASGRSAEALTQYEQAGILDPRVPDAPLGCAMALVDLRRYREARDRLTDAMKTYPDQSVFVHALIRLLAAAPDDRVRDGQTAMRLMQDALAREPRTAEINEMMAMTLAELGRYEEAANWQREAIADAERSGRAALARPMAETLSTYERRQPCRIPLCR